jgi:two-component system cell cycle sensor histidine kinase/response regulator CckA
MRSMAALADSLLRPRADLDLPTRYYQALCLLAGLLVTLVIVPVNLAQGLPLVVSVTALAFGITAIVLYRLSRRGRTYPAVAWLALMLLLNVNWWPNDGSQGGNAYYFVPAAMSAIVFFRHRQRAVALAGVVVNYLVLLWLEHAHPTLLTPFATPFDRTLDTATGVGGSIAAVGLMTWLMLEVYEQDRRQLQRTAEALVSSETQFQAIFQLNPDVVMLFDATERRAIAVNDGFKRLLGWTRDEAVGRTSAELAFWADPDSRDELYRRLGQQAHVSDLLVRMRRKNGVAFWASVSARMIDLAGRPCAIATARDVSAQIAAQRAVAESRVMLASFLNSTDDMLWMVQPDTFALVIFNDAFARYAAAEFGATAAPGLTLERSLPPELIVRWRELYGRALSGGPFTIEYRTRDDRTLLLSFNLVTLEGTRLGISVFARDITALKTAEEERDRIRLQLLQAQKMDSLGSLAGGVAHDFNNMLGGIMGYADLLLAGETDSARRDQLQAILRAAGRSSDLTRKLLAFARRGKNVVEAVDLNATIRESLTMLGPSMGPDLDLRLHLDARHGIDGDPTQLNQLVVNLCLNAREAMPDGGILTVSTRDVTDGDAADWALPPGPCVELGVSDTGVGIPDAVRERIFEPFFTTKSGGDVSGTGLGLSTVYGVVHLHRGAIRVDSTPGAGTTFLVRLPRGSQPIAPVTEATPQPEGRGTILVVEDEDMLRRLASTMLERLGYRTLSAADGAEGVELFRRHHPELSGVLLDLKMPRMGGRAAFEQMHAIAPDVPVLLCSGYGENEEAQSLISAGAAGLLSKPYRVADMAEHVARLRR